MRARISVFTSVFLLATAAAALDTPSASQTPSAQVDALFQKMDSTRSPGCALSVVKDGSIVYERGYGMADLNHNVPITPRTVFHVASMSKQFTAASIVLLAQQGKLSLDDPVRKYIRELPDFATPITIRQLIHHTSGLRDQWDLLDLAGWRYSLDLITDDDVLYLVSHQKDLNFPPGSKHVYCNTGYTLLAQIVKRVSGQSFREFTTSQIFQPLGMKDTHFRDDHAEIVKNMAYGYEPEKDTFKISITNFDTVGATSLLTTVEDLPLWDANFYNPRVGGPAMIKQELERGKLNDGEQLDYAFGLVLGTYRGLATVDHGGADAGYRSDMIRFPDQHLTVSCLCNLATSNPSELARKTAEIYLAKEMKPAETDHEPEASAIHLTPDQLKSKVGTYLDREDDEVIRISVKGEALQADRGSSEDTFDLKAIAENHFRLTFAPVDFTFEADSAAPRRLVEKQGRQKPVIFTEVRAFNPTAQQLNAYAAVYSSAEIDPLYELKVEDGGLVLHRLKHKPEAVRPVTEDIFVGSTGTIHFTRNAQGQVAGFLLSTGRIRNFRFTRGRPAI